ncbi:ribosomal protein S18-alanine N-acetyltransferase [Desulfurobacterium sp.]
MQNLLVRNWQIEDFKEIEAILKQLRWGTVTANHRLFSDPYAGKVAVMDGKIVGFVLYWIIEEEVEIIALVVDENYRRRSIGTTLMSSVIKELASYQTSFNVFLEVSEKNTPAIRLYEKLGFKKISVRKKYYKTGDDALVFMLKIKPNGGKRCTETKT